jgi:Ca2+-binding EF-hand superfamily protein
MNSSTRSGTTSSDATFARLDATHDGKLSNAEVSSDAKVKGMWKKLDANNDGSVSQAEFQAHASDLK